jgi:hypothetical protein
MSFIDSIVRKHSKLFNWKIYVLCRLENVHKLSKRHFQISLLTQMIQKQCQQYSMMLFKNDDKNHFLVWSIKLSSDFINVYRQWESFMVLFCVEVWTRKCLYNCFRSDFIKYLWISDISIDDIQYLANLSQKTYFIFVAYTIDRSSYKGLVEIYSCFESSLNGFR